MHIKKYYHHSHCTIIEWKNENTCDPCALASMFCQYFFDSWTIVSCEIPVKEGKQALSTYDCCSPTDMHKLECYWSSKAFTHFSFCILWKYSPMCDIHLHPGCDAMSIHTHTHLRTQWWHPKQKCYLYRPNGKHTRFWNDIHLTLS